MSSNPAALTEVENRSLEASIDAVLLRGTFSRSGEEDSRLRNRVNFLGDVALAIPSGHSALRFGLSALPTFAASTDWRYRDREGGADGKTSYGEIDHHSEFLAYNFQAGFGVDLSSWLSFGASAGAVYNHNALQTAYVFQSQKTLRSFKTRLDLDTEGYAPSAQLGVTIKPTSSLKLAAAYVAPSKIESEGTAQADLSAQLQSLGGGFAAVDPELKADAEVLTKLPQKVLLGAAWQITGKLLVTAEFDWVNWSAAFDELPVTLSNSSNTAVNGLVGSNRFTDVVPLGWRDQKIIRVGAEYELNAFWTLRAGYSYSNEVVPSETLTPLAAAIDDSVAAAGVGFRQPGWHLDLAWQWHLPKTRTVSDSQLQTGEYSNSQVKVESHWVGLTYGVEF
jgi:long-subunit fatty acid transport protein